MNGMSLTCDGLRVLLARPADDEQAAELERRICEHLATCPTCGAAEQRLTVIVHRYCVAEPVLPEELEQRLLDHMCGRSA